MSIAKRRKKRAINLAGFRNLRESATAVGVVAGLPTVPLAPTAGLHSES